MSGPRSQGGPPAILIGIVQLARGRPEGIERFGGTRENFLASFAPLIAFPLVGAGLALFDGEALQGLTELLQIVCALLVPPVVSYSLARRWGRESRWLRFATAFNWCQWAIPAVAMIALGVLSLMLAFGMPPRAAATTAMLGLGFYALWLHWFLARVGLEASPLRAVLLVLCVNVGTAIVLLLPYLPLILSGQPAREI